MDGKREGRAERRLSKKQQTKQPAIHTDLAWHEATTTTTTTASTKGERKERGKYPHARICAVIRAAEAVEATRIRPPRHCVPNKEVRPRPIIGSAKKKGPRWASLFAWRLEKFCKAVSSGSLSLFPIVNPGIVRWASLGGRGPARPLPARPALSSSERSPSKLQHCCYSGYVRRV